MNTDNKTLKKDFEKLLTKIRKRDMEGTKKFGFDNRIELSIQDFEKSFDDIMGWFDTLDY